jgi:hypothetical protein
MADVEVFRKAMEPHQGVLGMEVEVRDDESRDVLLTMLGIPAENSAMDFPPEDGPPPGYFTRDWIYEALPDLLEAAETRDEIVVAIRQWIQWIESEGENIRRERGRA